MRSCFGGADRSHDMILIVGDETTEMFRPVGPKELARIHQLGDRAFPPRLPSQPIFYPVLNEFYARKITSEWNATSPDTGYRGYVTWFRVRAAYAARFEIQTVGASWAKELWVPAEELDEFNSNIVGLIEVVAQYDGKCGGEVAVGHSRFTCPVCGYPDLCDEPRPAVGGGSYEICPSCGFQFGVSDEDRGFSFEGWRSSWIEHGMPWSSGNVAPVGWDPADQLTRLEQK
jgi:predicted RNA-binding Zn-ribbon protein involved in translation (DUF1610 family)